MKIGKLLRAVASSHGVTVDGIRGRSQLRRITVARADFYRQLRLHGFTYSRIGELVGRTRRSVSQLLKKHDGWAEIKGAAA